VHATQKLSSVPISRHKAEVFKLTQQRGLPSLKLPKWGRCPLSSLLPSVHCVHNCRQSTVHDCRQSTMFTIAVHCVHDCRGRPLGVCTTLGMHRISDQWCRPWAQLFSKSKQGLPLVPCFRQHCPLMYGWWWVKSHTGFRWRLQTPWRANLLQSMCQYTNTPASK